MRIRMTLRGEKALRGLTPTFLRNIIRETLGRSFPRVFQADRTVLLDVACVSDAAIAKLNGDYRRQAKPTDILSFSNVDGFAAITTSPDGSVVDLGQIVLSPVFIARAAAEDGVSWKREFVYVFSHGVLHLVGFDHEERMFDIQDAVTDALAPVISEKTIKQR